MSCLACWLQGKRGLPMYPLGVESTAAHTVTICAGEQLQLRRWRRFEPKEAIASCCIHDHTCL